VELHAVAVHRDRAQAEQMAKQMGGMSDAQMKVMMKAATTIQAGMRSFQKAKQFMVSKAALVVAVAILILAVVLRWLGIM
jgi:hypothetical protein